MAGAPDSLHLLLAGVAVRDPSSAEPPAPLPLLPALQALFKRLRPAAVVELAPDSPHTPYEHALAQAQGLADIPGRIPWAAFESGIVGTPCAWLHPCYWQLGMDSVALLDPAQLALSEAESRALLAPIAALMAQDGMALSWLRPDTWLAQGELFRDLTTWSVHRSAGQELTREVLALTASTAQRNALRRHQLEWQMLLHNQPVNDAREAAGRPFVNALWLDGAGVLPSAATPRPGVIGETRLRQAGADGARRTAAWQAIEADHAERLAAALRAGRPVRITLCGPYRARSFASGGGVKARIAGLFHGHDTLAECATTL